MLDLICSSISDSRTHQAILTSLKEFLGPFAINASCNTLFPERLGDAYLASQAFKYDTNLLVSREFPAFYLFCLPYNIVGFTYFKVPFRDKDVRLWSQKPPISSSFLHAGNYLKLSANSNNQTAPLYMTGNSQETREAYLRWPASS